MNLQEQQIFDRFISTWVHEFYQPKRETKKMIRFTEEQLNLSFPEIYTQFLINYGSFGTTRDLLDSIVEEDLDITDLSELYSSMDVFKITKQRREFKSLPKDLVVIGGDCSGNNFCFRKKECNKIFTDEAEIWVYDYTLMSLDKEADSFVDWINKLSLIRNIN